MVCFVCSVFYFLLSCHLFYWISSVFIWFYFLNLFTSKMLCASFPSVLVTNRDLLYSPGSSAKCSAAAAAAANSLQSCPTLWDPIDGSPPGSPIPGILQARTLEWIAISLSNAWKWKVKVKSLSHAWLLATPWTAAHQGPPSMGFSRQEYWSGVPLPSPAKYSIIT